MTSLRVADGAIIDLLCYVDKDRADQGSGFAQLGMSSGEVGIAELCEMVETLVEKVNLVLSIDQEAEGNGKDILFDADGRSFNIRIVKDSILSAIGAQGGVEESPAGELLAIGIGLGRDGFLELNKKTFKEALQGQKETSVNTVKVLNDSLYERLHWYVDPNAALLADLGENVRGPHDGDQGYIAELDAQLMKKKEELEKKLETVNMLISSSKDLIGRLTGQALAPVDVE
ncbi:MAG: hypothetical protein A4E62_00404 [Syntrophorhabdus sp. PtaU1.Bin002]|nr:MAG: hypothetical protein A4E58_00921 [Syntrophorhabdus sp. PtaB.Bin006]OPY73553.1 MAG: hypothetical protein A4E62_00404 [Syntrophorhabdus sp. PtaU1.Bin002]